MCIWKKNTPVVNGSYTKKRNAYKMLSLKALVEVDDDISVEDVNYLSKQ